MYRRIRDLRIDADLKQRQLALVLNIAQTTYSDYERGALDIPTQILIGLATKYNVSTDYLLDLTDDPAPPPRK